MIREQLKLMIFKSNKKRKKLLNGGKVKKMSVGWIVDGNGICCLRTASNDMNFNNTIHRITTTP